MKIISWLKQKINKGLKKMDKKYRNEDGVELTASNEIQQAAFENQGFKASKSKMGKADTEFASEMTPNAQSSANMGSSLTPNVDAKDMNTVQATSSSANNFATEFSQELGSQDASDESLAQADAKAAQKVNKAKK